MLVVGAAGPLLIRATCVVFEGIPTHPTPARCWQIVDKYQASNWQLLSRLVFQRVVTKHWLP
jgi:acetyl-CoA synthetase